MMPDVAMATASLGQLHLTNSGSGCISTSTRASIINNEVPESLQLDLGDGPSPHVVGTATSSITIRNIQLPPF
ncbi:uncharacterized protein Dana_GF28061 [Drosophila ananassae]|uniref:Uncharacterized protein n=2 Tax=Drosophila ananassae TaxID=7217 RepID=A0A0P8XLM1_DROAN|nr:uncharacterized protein Dana_GF28061 [Drosophila ananassae]